MKRVFAVVLSLILVLSLYGCGTGEAASAQTVPETTVPAETTVPPTEAEAEPPVTEPVFDLSTWQGNYDQGLYFMEGKRWQEAFDAFDAAVALDSQQPDAYAQRGNALILVEENEENLSLALEDYQRALAMDKANALAYLGIVDVHIRRGEYDEAKAAMNDAVKKTNNDPLLSKKVDQLDRGFFSDSSNLARYSRTKYYNGQGKYSGCVIAKYDNGNVISVESFDSKDKTTGFVEPSKVVNGNVEEKIWYDVTGCETEVTVRKVITTTTTNPDGTTEAEIVAFDRNNKRMSSDYTYYDANGRSIRSEHYDADCNLQSYSISEYDLAGNMIRNNRYYPDGTLEQYHIYEYDEKGNKTRVNFYDANGQLMTYIVYRYNEQGAFLGSEVYSANDNVESMIQRE